MNGIQRGLTINILAFDNKIVTAKPLNNQLLDKLSTKNAQLPWTFFASSRKKNNIKANLRPIGNQFALLCAQIRSTAKQEYNFDCDNHKAIRRTYFKMQQAVNNKTVFLSRSVVLFHCPTELSNIKY